MAVVAVTAALKGEKGEAGPAGTLDIPGTPSRGYLLDIKYWTPVDL